MPIEVDFTSALSLAPRVAMDSQGRFAVTWQDVDSIGNSVVMMRDYAASGSPLTAITQVSDPGSSNFQPDVAASDGSIVITWTHQFTATNHDIEAARYASSGGVLQAQSLFEVNVDSQEELAPSVAMSPDGRFDIAFERQFSASDWDIFASQYDASGNLVRGNIHVNFDGLAEFLPSVSMDAAGNAVVAYERDTMATTWVSTPTG